MTTEKIIQENSQLYRIKADEFIFFRIDNDSDEPFKTETLKKGTVILMVDRNISGKDINSQYSLEWPDENFTYCVFYLFTEKARIAAWWDTEDTSFFETKFELCENAA